MRKEKRLSFVPPDGNFELISFRVGEPYAAGSAGGEVGKGSTNGWSKAIPLTVSHCVELEKGQGTALIQVQASTFTSSSSTSISGGNASSSFGNSSALGRNKGPDPPERSKTSS